MSLVDLSVAVAQGLYPNVLDLPAGSWISPGRIHGVTIEATGGSIVVNDALGGNMTIVPGDGPQKFTPASGLGFINGVLIVDAAAGTARITWTG